MALTGTPMRCNVIFMWPAAVLLFTFRCVAHFRALFPAGHNQPVLKTVVKRETSDVKP
jgi:hypothetical protein